MKEGEIKCAFKSVSIKMSLKNKTCSSKTNIAMHVTLLPSLKPDFALNKSCLRHMLFKRNKLFQMLHKMLQVERPYTTCIITFNFN